jgi:hypothetical protein
MRTTEANPIDTTSWITLRWVRGTRYYRVHLEQDLARVAADQGQRPDRHRVRKGPQCAVRLH